MEITKQEVEKVAKLARLALSEAETTAFSQQLNQIVAYVQKLKTFSTEGVEPTSTVLGQSNVFRPDAVEASLSPEQAVGNAPDAEASCFRVPKIIQESYATEGVRADYVSTNVAGKDTSSDGHRGVSGIRGEPHGG